MNPNKQGAAMNKIKRAAVALAMVAGSLGVATATHGTASALQSCHAQLVTTTWSDAWCYDGAGPARTIQAYAVCIWPGQPNGIRQTVRGGIVSSVMAYSTASCPSGKVVYSYGYISTY